MGTTCTALAFADGGVFLGHVGDSRAYVLREGALRQISEDHSLVGMMVRAGASNREMIGSLGIDIGRLYRWVFAAGVALAALAGAVAAPVSSVYPGMGAGVLIMCFVVVVIGGIGSIRGAFLAAMLVGLVETFGRVVFPAAAGVLVYVLMAGILLCKPEGLFKQG
jgi:branched-chain amino acid transport system permease protein